MMLVAVALAVQITGPSFAQGGLLFGQTPPGLDWRQIRTDRFMVIFLEATTAIESTILDLY